MSRVHILTGGMGTPNVAAFCFPMIRHRRALRDRGITWRSFTHETAELSQCDVLLVETRYHGPKWSTELNRVIEDLARFKASVPRLGLLDLSDSTGYIKTSALPVVDIYLKSQILWDRSKYQEPLYGNRLHTDYYHRTASVNDSVPIYQNPVMEAKLLDKIRVGWNSGLANYSFPGVYRQVLFAGTGWPWLLRFPTNWGNPAGHRSTAVSCRISANYQRETIAWQRQRVRDILADFVAVDRLSRRQYFRELRSSRIVVSPFGFGEINYRDYETFLAGAALLKPDMSHMETWPDFYHKDETYLSHRWNLDDLEETLVSAIDDPGRCQEIAAAAQQIYRKHIEPVTGAALFCDQFQRSILA
ncbi:MAG: glycosyltransferase family 1 protein [Rhodospirillales bacterium]|nr:glycosyltransferase family 1 protein [Rhodospirillales bacterium]